MIKCLLLILLISFNLNASAEQITAQAWLVSDGEGNIIEGQNTDSQRSIASITKLMTVMVVLDAKQDLNEKIGAYTRREMILLALVKSDNTQAERLCEYYIHGKSGCVREMNLKAQSLGLTRTRYVDPTGLGLMNISTAEDLIKIVLTAQNYPEIVFASQLSEVKIQIRKKWLVFKNTNPIIGKRYHFVVSKTGYIRASGGCIVMMLDTDVGRRIVVVLGSKNTHTRIPEAEFIALK
jgi:D-alanyl-D-alanine endopeptidase (penicillin-binding protein 7)